MRVRELLLGAQSMLGVQPTVVVTGANRGIGLEISRQLLKRGAQVVITSRSLEGAERALADLRGEQLDPAFHLLNVTEPESADSLKDFIEDRFGSLDVLINNAGVLDGEDSGLEVPLGVLRATLETNTIAPLRMAQTLAPLLRKSERGGRIINISSGMGALSDMSSGYAAYRISKTALNAVTGVLAAELKGAVSVNSMCPGWVRTDMGGPNANRNVREGADTAVWLALDAPASLTGKFLRDRRVIPW